MIISCHRSLFLTKPFYTHQSRNIFEDFVVLLQNLACSSNTWAYRIKQFNKTVHLS